MSIEAFLSGFGGVIVGTLLGSYLTSKLTYDFNKRLMDTQLEALKKSHEENMRFLKDAHADFIQQFNNISSSITHAILDIKSKS